MLFVRLFRNERLSSCFSRTFCAFFFLSTGPKPQRTESRLSQIVVHTSRGKWIRFHVAALHRLSARIISGKCSTHNRTTPTRFRQWPFYERHRHFHVTSPILENRQITYPYLSRLAITRKFTPYRPSPGKLTSKNRVLIITY